MSTYRFINKANVQYDDAHPDYYLTFVMGDQFEMYLHGTKYVVIHEHNPEILFSLTKKEGNALMKMSEERLTVRPDPTNAPYLLFEPKIEMVKPLYDYYNKLYFNGACPPVKIVKARKAGVWGMAEMKWSPSATAPNRKALFTLHVNESSMIDRVLFTNTIIHEMIHLYNYVKGVEKLPTDPERAMALIHANHGPLFQSEMHRINTFGFHIILAGTHEEIARDATEEFYAIIAERGVPGALMHWSSWYTHKVITEDDLQTCAAKLKEAFPHEAMVVKLITTKERVVTQGTNLKSTKAFTDASLKKMFVGNYNYKDAKVLGEAYNTPSISVALPEYTDAPDIYALPFDKFCIAMKKYTKDRSVLFSRWKLFPVRLLNKDTETRLKSLINRTRRGGATDADIMNAIQDFKGAYDQRQPMAVYQKAVSEYLKMHDGNGVLTPYMKLMGLR
jgi:hypothetical protein